MMPPIPHALLDKVMPQLVQEWAALSDHALRDAVALVFAPGVVPDVDPYRPTALLVKRDVARHGLVLACREEANMAPLATFDSNYTDGGQLVVVVFDHDVTGTIVMKRGVQGRLDLN
jgi:hypothetical protein